MASLAAAIRISPPGFPRYSNSRWRSRVSHLHESAAASCAVGIDGSRDPRQRVDTSWIYWRRTPSPFLLPLITSSRDDQRRLRYAAAPLDVKWISFKRRRDSSSHRFRNNFVPWECASPERLSTLRRGSDTVCGQSPRTCVSDYPELFSGKSNLCLCHFTATRGSGSSLQLFKVNCG